ncbi:hypothetical protein ACFQ6N_03495 [Kitasatospora sp. NPDC056446]
MLKGLSTVLLVITALVAVPVLPAVAHPLVANPATEVRAAVAADIPLCC